MTCTGNDSSKRANISKVFIEFKNEWKKSTETLHQVNRKHDVIETNIQMTVPVSAD